MRSSPYSRFFRTDLQVHTPADPQHEYGQCHGREDAVARAIVDAHLDAGVDVIAVTDHVDLAWYPRIAAAADAVARDNPDRRLWVFPGFEVNASRCHLILLWDGTEAGYETAQRHLAGLYPANVSVRKGTEFRPLEDSPHKVAREAVETGALVIAPHSTKNGMGAFAGQVVTNVGDLVASGHVSAWDVHGSKTNGVLHGPQQYFGDRTPAWICTGDTRSLATAGQRSIWLKMDQPPSLNGLRHAFLAPETRIRFPSALESTYGHVRYVRFAEDVEPSCARITHVRVEGGFHGGLDIDLAPGLNAIIGGRGTGKSALVEIIRYGLGQADPDVERLVENRRRNLPVDAEVTIDVVTTEGTRYSVHRAGGDISGPTVTRADGQRVEIEPSARFWPKIYGQTQLRSLVEVGKLREFCAQQDPERWARISSSETEGFRTLRRLSDRMRHVEDETSQKDEKEAELHELEDRLHNAEKAGAEDRIDELRTVATVSQQVATAAAWPQRVATAVAGMRAVLPAPGCPDHDDVPGELAAAIRSLEEGVIAAVESLEQAVANTEAAVETAAAEWAERSDARTSAIGAELAAVGIERPEQLAADQRRAAVLTQEVTDLAKAQDALHEVAVQWSDALDGLRSTRRERGRFFRSVAEALNGQLAGAVRLVVEPMAIHDDLETMLRKHTTGVHSTTISRAAGNVRHPQTLVDAVRQARQSPAEHATEAVAGREALGKFGLTDGAINQLIQLNESAIREIEMTDVPDRVRLEMNLGTSEDPRWQDVERMSPGQSATALLALALIGGTEPLIVDQPEEDLDNRFVFREVVGKVAETCDRRQVIVVTHDANIPIVGDAELILALDAGATQGRVLAYGGLERPDVAQHARDILEGGEDAFQERMRRYPASTTSR